MEKIVFLNNWGETPAEYLNLCAQQTPNGDGRWNDIQGVSRIDEADYYVILDDFPANFDRSRFDPEKVIYLQREPNHIRQPQKPPQVKYIHTYETSSTYALWWIKKPFNQLKDLGFIKTSPLTMALQKSCIWRTNKSKIIKNN